MYEEYKDHCVKIFMDVSKSPNFYGFIERTTEKMILLNRGLSEEELKLYFARNLLSEFFDKSLASFLEENGTSIKVLLDNFIAIKEIDSNKKLESYMGNI